MVKKKEKKKGENTASPIGKLAESKFSEHAPAQYRLLLDSPQSGVEKNYFTILRTLTDKQPFGRGFSGEDGEIIKTKDIYSAGETSSYWGNVEARKGIQIDKFQQIMQNIGSMIKQIFQLLRELRILDERLEHYDGSYGGDAQSEVYLKSTWVDMVEGGIKNTTSVLGLTSQIGFAALADLFFKIHPKTSKDIEKELKQLKGTINRKVLEVLGRKLKQYLVWKEKTYKELQVRKNFNLGYLRQHYSVIRLYLNWLRPYLKNIQRLQMKSTTDHSKDKDLIAAFETSKIELEFLAIRKKGFKNVFPVIRVKINFVAMPQMSYNAENQRGAGHSGQTEIIIEGSAATKEELEEYQKDLVEEDLSLISFVDESINAMKDELTFYLEQAGGLFDVKSKSPKEEDEDSSSIFEPFIALGGFFKEVTGIKPQKGKVSNQPSEKEIGNALSAAALDSYLGYYIFKKQNQMLTE